MCHEPKKVEKHCFYNCNLIKLKQFILLFSKLDRSQRHRKRRQGRETAKHRNVEWRRLELCRRSSGSKRTLVWRTRGSAGLRRRHHGLCQQPFCFSYCTKRYSRRVFASLRTLWNLVHSLLWILFLSEKTFFFCFCLTVLCSIFGRAPKKLTTRKQN